MSLKLQIIICSTRPGRVGPAVAKWFYEWAEKQQLFQCELVDLADFKLPVYDEPNHPKMQKYEHDHTKAWSKSVAKADAYIFVLPEYNFCPPPSFTNALDYVYSEWNYKPAGFVSYGGVSGGLRSAQLAKQWVTAVKMMPMFEGVMVQMPWTLIDDNGRFQPEKPHEESAEVLLKELLKWAEALKPMRSSE